MRTSFYLSSALRFILVASAILSTYSEEIRKRSLRAENVVKFDKKDDGSNHVQTTYLNSTANINSQRRRLVRITSYGGTPDASYFPLGECEGGT